MLEVGSQYRKQGKLPVVFSCDYELCERIKKGILLLN